jgi:hypothetical protein
VALRAVLPPSSLNFTGVDDQYTRFGFCGSTRTCE